MAWYPMPGPRHPETSSISRQSGANLQRTSVSASRNRAVCAVLKSQDARQPLSDSLRMAIVDYIDRIAFERDKSTCESVDYSAVIE